VFALDVTLPAIAIRWEGCHVLRTEPDHHDAVGRALTVLADGLVPYVDRVVAERLPGADWTSLLRARDSQSGRRGGSYSKCDLSLLLRAMTERLGSAGLLFERDLTRQARGYASELREIRNQWAHNEPFGQRTALRAMDSAELLLDACGAEKEAGQVAEIRSGLTESDPLAQFAGSLSPLPAVRPELQSGVVASRSLDDRDRGTDVVHITLGRLKMQPNDAFGRPWIGFDRRKSLDDLWTQNRGYWKLDHERAGECELAIFSHQGEVVMVAEISGLEPSAVKLGKYAGRFAFEGRPVADHWLIGRPQPVARSTGNPVAYGVL